MVLSKDYRVLEFCRVWCFGKNILQPHTSLEIGDVLWAGVADVESWRDAVVEGDAALLAGRDEGPESESIGNDV